jgi:hypothetical protein
MTLTTFPAIIFRTPRRFAPLRRGVFLSSTSTTHTCYRRTSGAQRFAPPPPRPFAVPLRMPSSSGLFWTVRFWRERPYVLEAGAKDVLEGCFDGGYPYFSAEGFTPASRRDFGGVGRILKHGGGLFSASVGPGYDDTRIRPWNGANRRERRGGRYFLEGLQSAQDSGADFISITSVGGRGGGS